MSDTGVGAKIDGWVGSLTQKLYKLAVDMS